MKRLTAKDFEDMLRKLEALTGLKLYIHMTYFVRGSGKRRRKVPCYSLAALDEGGSIPLVDGSSNIGGLSLEDRRCFYNCLEMVWSVLSSMQGKTINEVTI